MFYRAKRTGEGGESVNWHIHAARVGCFSRLDERAFSMHRSVVLCGIFGTFMKDMSLLVVAAPTLCCTTITIYIINTHLLLCHLFVSNPVVNSLPTRRRIGLFEAEQSRSILATNTLPEHLLSSLCSIAQFLTTGSYSSVSRLSHLQHNIYRIDRIYRKA